MRVLNDLTDDVFVGNGDFHIIFISEKRVGKMNLFYLTSYTLNTNCVTNNKGTFYVFEVKRTGPATSEQKEKAMQFGSMFANKDLNFEAESEAAKPTTQGMGDEF